MLLRKDGITQNITHPNEIARYKHIGFKEVAAAEPAPEVTADFSDLTVEELKDLAKSQGLKGYSGLKREELIELLKAG